MREEEFSREERLLIWLRRKGLSYAALAKMLGITRMSALRLCKAKQISSIRHMQLSGLGLPLELLPEVQDRPRGRKGGKVINK
jgi:transcriptional regulator with XRE-family HTH domain